jgi:hypothetical protein
MSKASLHLALFVSSVFDIEVEGDADKMSVEMSVRPKFIPATHYVQGPGRDPAEARVATYLSLKVLHRWMAEELEKLGEELGEVGVAAEVNMSEPEGGAKA